MALGSNHVTLTNAEGGTRTRSSSAFIRELWSDEIIASYKANFVLVPLVNVMNHRGKKGDTIHVPNPVRGSASSKSSETQVTLISNNESKKQYLIDQHYEYSRLIEDIVSVQAEDSLRQFYTDDAGHALSKQVDTFLHNKGARLNGAGLATAGGVETEAGSDYDGAVVGTPSGTPSTLDKWDPSANTNEGNASTITDAGFRLMMQNLDDNDVPSMGRVLVVPPVEKRKMLGIDRQIVFDQVGESGRQNAIRNGFVGPLYGSEVFVSTNTPTVQDSASNGNDKAALYFQKDALLLIEQMAPRTQTQYIQQYLGDLFTADTIYGGGVLRPEAGIPVIVPA